MTDTASGTPLQASSQPAESRAGDGLDRRAWLAQYRNLSEAAALGQQLALDGGSPAERAIGHCHAAFALTRLGAPAEGEQALDAAWTLVRAAGESAADALIDCRNVQGMLLRRQKRPEAALTLLRQNLAAPATVGSPDRSELLAFRRCVGHTLAGMSCSDLGQLDDTLRHYLMARNEAQRSGDAALLANACANLSGVQADLMNLEDAAELSEEAVVAAEHAGLRGRFIWLTANYNRCYIALCAGDGALARTVAQGMREWSTAVPAAKRARYELIWAKAAVAAGELIDAARLLTRSRRRWASDDDLLLEWSVVRAALDNAAGRQSRTGDLARRGSARFVRARAVCDAARELTTSGGEEALPLDRMHLFEQGSIACEALGDTTAALAYARLAFAQYELVAGRSARARRVTEEARLALQLERRSHEESVRRRLAAEDEQRRLAELNAALHEANLAKTRFLAAASHDLRQPMHALALQSANLRAALDGPEQVAAAAVAERLEHNVLALSAMFDALLDISQVESGGLPVHRAAVPLRGLLLRLVEELQPQAEARGLRMALRLPPAAGRVCVDTDPALLETMLRNLLANALKYTVQGGVMLAMRRCHRQPAHWLLQVIDTGVGIEPAWQQKVFEDFVQVDNPQRQRSRGLGLGLAIVRRLAALLGHPLSLRSKPGHGTCVSLQLIEAEMADGVIPAARDTAMPEPGLLVGCRVAVVEDDPDALQALVELLRLWQLEIVPAGDADGLLQALGVPTGVAAPPIDALITDLRLPGACDGLALAKELREQPGLQHLPVLVVTADLGRQPAPQVDWLVKPVTAKALHDWLQRRLPQVTAGTPRRG